MFINNSCLGFIVIFVSSWLVLRIKAPSLIFAHHISTLVVLLLYYDDLLEKRQCIPTMHGGRIVRSAQPLLTQKL